MHNTWKLISLSDRYYAIISSIVKNTKTFPHKVHKNQRVIPSLKAPHPTTVDSLLTNWSVLPIGGRQTGAIADENVTGESNVRIATSLY